MQLLQSESATDCAGCIEFAVVLSLTLQSDRHISDFAAI
jgi:hypothetical protein